IFEASQFEKKRPTDAAQLKKWCKDIYDKYIPKTAKLQINLPDKMKKALDENVGKAPCKEYDDALETAVKELIRLEKANWNAMGGTGGNFHGHFKAAIEKQLLDGYRKDNA